MAKINLLGKEIAELIAAGEVIERPASIVKELVENSVDAQASTITVELQNGGTSYIRITDNGCGISKEDLPLAFLRHATSKVVTADDLDSIATLGFRGEALASICAVSKVSIMSKTKEQSRGYELSMVAGKFENENLREVNCAVGTTLIVRDLFFNVPARLKFLKSSRSETMAVSQILDKLAISHPEISIKFIVDNKIKFYTAGDGNVVNAVAAVLGSDFSMELTPLHYEYNGMVIDGYVTDCSSNNSFGRNNRGMQHFFVNSRYVKSKTCFVALEEAFKNSIMVGKFPGCVINLTLPFNTVDVNVHPAKIEIRFSNEKSIFELVYFGVKNVLSKNNLIKHIVEPVDVTLVSAFSEEQQEQVDFVSMQVDSKPNENNVPFSPSQQVIQTKINGFNLDTGEIIKQVQDEALQMNDVNSVVENTEVLKEMLHEISPEISIERIVQLEQDDTIVEQGYELERQHRDEKTHFVSRYLNIEVDNEQELAVEKNQVVEDLPKVEDIPTQNYQIKYIGEVFKTYIIVEIDDMVITIDKHAAHEKIIFDKLKEDIGSQLSRQILLVPIKLYISKDELLTVQEKSEQLHKLGFVFEELDESIVLLTEVPSVLDSHDIKEIFMETIDRLERTHIDIVPHVLEETLHSMACRKAIKSNDVSYKDELVSLATQVCQSGELRYCPHGRPIVIVESKREYDKKFGRI